MTDTEVTIQLTMDEALVLYDWICRFNADGSVKFEDQAEQRVLFDLEAILEKKLVAPLSPDYERLLLESRSRVRDPEEEEQ